MKSNSPRNFARIKVTANGVSHLFLELSEVLALRRDSAAFRGVPGGDQCSRFVSFDLKDNFFHDLTYSPRPSSVNRTTLLVSQMFGHRPVLQPFA